MENTLTDLSGLSGTESVGAILRTTREAQGLTIENMADRIKFSVRQLEALEGNNLELLPQGAFLRGFVRSYARALQLDEAPLIAALASPPLSTIELGASQANDTVLPSISATTKNNAYILGAAALLVVGLGIFLLTKPNESVMSKVTLEELALPALEAASSVSASDSQVVEASAVVVSAPVVVVAPLPVSAIAKAPAVTPAAPQSIPSVPAKSPNVVTPVVVPTPATAVSDAELALLKRRPIHIVFTQDSWMEIVDTRGDVLLSRMTVAGSEKWIGGRGRAPYQVSIGKVEAVKIYYRGREVDLSQYKQGGVTHLVLE